MILIAEASILPLFLLIWIFLLISKLGERPAKRGFKTVRPGDIQIQYFGVFSPRFFVHNLYLFLVMLFLMSSVASFAGNKTNTGDKLISLTAKDEPLGDVLNKISMATGYEIDLDHEWQNYLVSVNLEEVPLDKGLKRILKDLNNVIVYVSSKKIEIIIYDKISPEKGSAMPSVDTAPISRQPSYGPAEPDAPESQALETEEALPDYPAVSDEGSENAPSKNGGSKSRKVENIKSRTDKEPRTNLEDGSSKRPSEQNNQSQSPAGEDSESAGTNE